MKTVELINKMRQESKEVKNSNGGTKIFRAIMDTIMANEIKIIGDYDKAIRLKSEEIAEIVEKQYTKEEIDSIKIIYETN